MRRYVSIIVNVLRSSVVNLRFADTILGRRTVLTR